jgi:CheY-like chemotaxis protein
LAECGPFDFYFRNPALSTSVRALLALGNAKRNYGIYCIDLEARDSILLWPATHMRILIADDHEAVRRGVRALLDSRDGWKVCGEADNGRAAIEKTKEVRPDLVILDIAMPVVNGFDAAKVIKELYPDTAILAYSILQSEGFLNESRRIGFDGYISKSDGARAVLKAVDEVQHRRSLT